MIKKKQQQMPCHVKVDEKHVDPWNIRQWKDWEYCQGTYRRLYAIDTVIPSRELYLVNEFINQLNDDYKFKRHFMLVTKLPITLEKKEAYDTLNFFVYDQKSTITREYIFQYQWLNAQQVKVLKGFRSRTELQDKVVLPTAPFNADKYNQLGQTHASYFMSLNDTKPHLTPFPMSHEMYSFTNAPSNLALTFESGHTQLPEKAGVFKASNFSSAF
jgi:hypothetical protein